MIQKLKSLMKKSAVILLLIVTLSTTYLTSNIIEGSSASICSKEMPEIDVYNTSY